MARWVIASVAFLAIGGLAFRYGHTVALVTLLAILLLVAVFGGHGPRRRPGDAGGPEGAGAADAAPGSSAGPDDP